MRHHRHYSLVSTRWKSSCRRELIQVVFRDVDMVISDADAAGPASPTPKQRVSRGMRGRKRRKPGQLTLRFSEAGGRRRFWQRRYYDFNVYSRAKVLEELHFMHANPVKERLVQHPGDWPWSSWCFYYRGEGLLNMDVGA